MGRSCLAIAAMVRQLLALLSGCAWGELHRVVGSGLGAWTQCGVKGRERQRIVNGQDAGECVWRWQASINTDRYGQFCGATLITSDWILTAAHCVKDVHSPCAVQSLRIGVGAYSRSLRELANDEHSVERRVQGIYIHPLYQKNVNHDYDFALIRLDKAVPINRCIGVACLPTDAHVGSNCTITGWGTLHSQGGQPEVLQQAPVEFVNRKSCEENYTATKDTITASMMCAAGRSKGGITDSCQGDSGGPLVCQQGDGRYSVQGVTSWGQGCGLPNFPGVYARVASSLAWIEDVLEGKVKPKAVAHEDEVKLNFKGQVFVVLTGDCTVDEDGCVSSPGYDSGAYGNNERCRIAVNAAVATPLRVENFSTEAGYDSVVVNCRRYSGSKGPSGVIPSSSILWSTDSSTVDEGWKLCPS